VRIAKPLILTMTPIGVGWGLIEAARFHWWLAVLMAVLLGVISLFVWSVVRRIRSERQSSDGQSIGRGSEGR
jgi:membrane protein implicated in regulation of membrane protease activity